MKTKNKIKNKNNEIPMEIMNAFTYFMDKTGNVIIEIANAMQNSFNLSLAPSVLHFRFFFVCMVVFGFIWLHFATH